MRYQPFLALLAGLAFPLAAASEGVAADELLKKVAATYHGLTSYQFQVTTSTQVTSDGALQQLIETNIALSGINPDRERLELQGSRNRVFLIRAGDKMYADPPSLTLPQMQELLYAGVIDEGGNIPLQRAKTLLLHRYEKLITRAAQARLMGEVNLDLATGRRPCYLVQIGEQPSPTSEPPEQYWIDQTRYLVLKSVVREKAKEADSERVIRTVVTYKSAVANEPLNPLLFALAPRKPGRTGGKTGQSGSAPGTEPLRAAESPKRPVPKAKVMSVTKVKKAGE